MLIMHIHIFQYVPASMTDKDWLVLLDAAIRNERKDETYW